MNRIYSLLITLTMLASASAVAEWADHPTGALDSRTAQIQSKVDSLYRRGDFKRAHFIYSNELAPLGDKYAQYMTGYMYLMGQGVEEDPVRASAWYRIAAERKTPEFLIVRDQLLRTLTDEQRVMSDTQYLELRKKISDLVVVMELLAEDLEQLDVKRTGSRLPGSHSSVMIIDPSTGIPVSSASLRIRVLRAVQARLDFVTQELDIDDMNAEDAKQHVDVLWERIHDYLGVVDDEMDAYVANPGK